MRAALSSIHRSSLRIHQWVFHCLLADVDDFTIARRFGGIFDRRFFINRSLLLDRRLPFRSPLAREGAKLRQTFEREEGADDVRVELQPGPEYEVLARLYLRARGSEGSRVRERGVGVCDAEYARAERNLLAAQGVGVARAAEPLVVPSDE